MWRSQLIFASFTTMFANSFSRLKMHPFCPLFHPSNLRPPPLFSMTVMENNENPCLLPHPRKLTVSREGIGIQYYISPIPYYIYHQFLSVPSPLGRYRYVRYAEVSPPREPDVFNKRTLVRVPKHFFVLICIISRIMCIFMRMNIEYFYCMLAYSLIFRIIL